MANITRHWSELQQVMNCKKNITKKTFVAKRKVKKIKFSNQYIRCYLPTFDQILKVGFWDHLEQISNVRMTFVQATFVMTLFVHIRNISAVTDPILTKLER